MSKPTVPTSERHELWLDQQSAPLPHVTRPALKALGPVVYAVQTRDGLIKIGWTTDLSRRALQCGYGPKSIIGIQFGTLADEQAIHNRLGGLAVRGREWYPWLPPVVAVVNEMRAALGISPITEPRAA